MARVVRRWGFLVCRSTRLRRDERQAQPEAVMLPPSRLKLTLCCQWAMRPAKNFSFSVAQQMLIDRLTDFVMAFDVWTDARHTKATWVGGGA